MTTVLANLRRLAAPLGPVMGLVLACSLVVTAFHHHDGNASSHACAVCSASHTPAVTHVASAGTPAPAPRAERVAALPAECAPQGCVVAIAARGPPSA